jgi:hypothetical protein
MQNYVFSLPALVRKVEFTNIEYIYVIPNKKDLEEENLIEELWWSPIERASFRRDATIETVREYRKLPFDQQVRIGFDKFTRKYWCEYSPPPTPSPPQP